MEELIFGVLSTQGFVAQKGRGICSLFFYPAGPLASLAGASSVQGRITEGPSGLLVEVK